MMKRSVKRLGIIGGTFDPVHTAHLVIAEAARAELNLDRVVFIPAGTPPHKDAGHITDESHRLEMTKRAVKDNPSFCVSDMEICREGESYTVDTLAELKGLYGQDCSMYFIVGADTVWDLFNWKDFQEVFNMCGFAAAARPGYDQKQLNERIVIFKDTYCADITLLDVPNMDISSTNIRERIFAGKPVRYLIPERARQYIIENGLYADEKKDEA